MSIPTKIVHSLQVACCLSILLLLVHAGAREGADYYGGSPTVTTLLLITSAHLLMSGCLLAAECTSSSNIYESPLLTLMLREMFFQGEEQHKVRRPEETESIRKVVALGADLPLTAQHPMQVSKCNLYLETDAPRLASGRSS
ncbi:hypothetical protein TNCV_16701 [Trichonephila clavipes]|nr:hypothetical protein TNCV_16701 [Trichonephila clavipes]